MPHVVVSGAPSLDQFWREFEPYQEVNGPEVRNLLAAYLRADATQMLILALAIELGVTQRFLIVVEQKKSTTVIRCQQHTPVEKTDGVKTLVAKVASLMIERGATLEKTNLPEL